MQNFYMQSAAGYLATAHAMFGKDPRHYETIESLRLTALALDCIILAASVCKETNYSSSR